MASNESLVGRNRRFDNLKLGRLLADIAEDAKTLDPADRAFTRNWARRPAFAGRASQATGAAGSCRSRARPGDGPVMSIRRLSLGAGYRYLMESIAVGDGRAEQSSSLTRYYAE